MAVTYRELVESESCLHPPQKWKQDPDANRFGGFFAPRNKYYANGILVGEDKPVVAETSPTPFPERRVPRRGLLQVFPDDPDYGRICLEQGLGHLVKGDGPGSQPNGMHSPPASHAADAPMINAAGPIRGPIHDSPDAKAAHGTTNGNGLPANGSLPNGIAGVDS